MRMGKKIGLTALFLLGLASGASGQQVVIPSWKTQNGYAPGNSAGIVRVAGGPAVVLPAVTWARQLIYAHVTYTTNATVGNRLIVLQLLDPNSVVVGDWHASATATASGVWMIEFSQGTYRETAFDASKSLQVPFPMGLLVPAGYSVKVFDEATISAGDSQVTFFQTTP